MESKETVIEPSLVSSSVNPIETPLKGIDAEKDVPLLVAAPEVTKPLISGSHESTQSTKASTPISETEPQQVTNDLWQQVTQIWDEYFGEGKKSNFTIAVAAIAIIPLLIITSALLNFLNKLPLLPSIFELVGFGYSGWFIYRYLLLANTRQELTDAISAWKNKVLG